ncbi:MAG: putative sulfate exporter family transporter [Holophaga sp.]|nr:putative sulfate exporter family transporter [Holophaga sp.]
MEDTRLLPRIVWPLAAALTLLPWCGAATALLGGVVLAVALGNPYQALFKRWTGRLLPWSVIGLGAGMDLRVVIQAGIHGLGYTVVSISLTLALGLWLARRMGVAGNTGLLVSVGTAICGGSAIAAVAPVINAEEHETSVALGTVFLLNAAALVIFPFVGHVFHLSQEGFGLWAALAIHDTSSVVGAALSYGRQALQIAVTVKLARALWIVPVAFGIGLATKREPGAAKGKRPWFILGFLIAAALATYVPILHIPAQWVARGAKQGLVLTLFLIGAGLTPATLRKVGVRPFLHGLLLWVIIGSASLAAVLAGILR